jgi:hypothetical protein
MPPATATRRVRFLAMLAVLGLHLLGGLLITRTLREPRSAEWPSPVTVWLAWRGNSNPAEASLRKRPAGDSRARSVDKARGASARSPAPAAPSPRLTAPPAAASASSPNVDWTSELRAAASASIENTSRRRRRNSSMASTPKSPYVASPRQPIFPWSHQPLGEHYDFDTDTGVFTLRTKHCVFAFWLILPGFACAPVHLDPEPGEGDLFDRRYAPWELQLPKSLQEARQAPP